MFTTAYHRLHYDNAKWIAVMDENTRGEKKLTTTGTYYYCDKHKHAVADIGTFSVAWRISVKSYNLCWPQVYTCRLEAYGKEISHSDLSIFR
jgi:hypothetical protein